MGFRGREKKRPGSLVSQATMCSLRVGAAHFEQGSITEGHCRAIDSLVVPSVQSGQFDDSGLQTRELCAGMFT